MWRLHDRSEGKMSIHRAKNIFTKRLIWPYHLDIFFKVLYNNCILFFFLFINIYENMQRIQSMKKMNFGKGCK